ncbi:hypothetical protein FBZ89_11272 [Nitrospirillum amazonense]|uniref:Uncharacterized protein n=1 Tax=Nitrospirillum amazonense TaxID=28077 RepID=A0A560F5T0_9PROT|nr:hypothetical protein [Nitrospirillum amazonense]TWB16915.1 hypothetical protein FBZ89_11272 [Nitrospirillum amazonense]
MTQYSTYSLVLREHIADLDPLIDRWTSGHFRLTGAAQGEAEEFVGRLKELRADLVSRMTRPDLDGRIASQVADGMTVR